MLVALYARTSAADLGREAVEQILAGLAAYAAGRVGKVALECKRSGSLPRRAERGPQAAPMPPAPTAFVLLFSGETSFRRNGDERCERSES